MLQRMQKFFTQKGQGIVEYALILAFVVAIAAVALNSSGNDSLGAKIKTLFNVTGQKIQSASDSINSDSTTTTPANP
ncbi:MAG: hypothetical protein IJU00_03020 [Selenomonas sp.]|nr:hypothetical protein [Selenomonas sp.]